MKYILSPNPEPPFNLKRTFPNFRDPTMEHLTEKEALKFIIGKLRHDGIITDDYWIVDEVDLPGGKVSEETDRYFDAWEMTDGKVIVNQDKVKELGL